MTAAAVAVAAAASTAKTTIRSPKACVIQHSEISPTIAPPGIRTPARLSSFRDVVRRRLVPCVFWLVAVAAPDAGGGCAAAGGAMVAVAAGGAMS
jgi:hypothetical protein